MILSLLFDSQMADAVDLDVHARDDVVVVASELREEVRRYRCAQARRGRSVPKTVCVGGLTSAPLRSGAKPWR